MDLISAKVEAAARSRKEGKTIYIIVDQKDGECDLATAPLKGVYTAYKNGGEIALEVGAEVTATTPKAKKGKTAPKEMSKVKSSAPTSGDKNKKVMGKKKEVKKAVAKKVATGTGKATTLILSDAQWKKVEGLIAKEGSIREMVAKAMIKTYSL